MLAPVVHVADDRHIPVAERTRLWRQRWNARDIPEHEREAAGTLGRAIKAAWAAHSRLRRIAHGLAIALDQAAAVLAKHEESANIAHIRRKRA